MLTQYVTQGVEELDTEKLTPLLRLKYHNAISDAVADLGGPTQIRTMFAGFQKYLYAGDKSGRHAPGQPQKSYFATKLIAVRAYSTGATARFVL